jgi:hypothetical protein
LRRQVRRAVGWDWGRDEASSADCGQTAPDEGGITTQDICRR